MNKFPILFLCFCTNIKLVIGAEAYWNHYYEKNFIQTQDMQKLIRLSADLLSESVQKISQVQDELQDNAIFQAFEVGMVMGRIREKYKEMMAQFLEVKNMYTGRTLHLGVTHQYWHSVMRPVHYLIKMELVHTLEMEIGVLIDVLLQADASGLDDTQSLFALMMKKNSKTMSRKADHDDKFEKEQEVKRHYRQEYLNKRLGMPINSTTVKKRFLDRWPVEETWDLQEY